MVRHGRVVERIERAVLDEMAVPARECVSIESDTESRAFRHADGVVCLLERPALDNIGDLPAEERLAWFVNPRLRGTHVEIGGGPSTRVTGIAPEIEAHGFTGANEPQRTLQPAMYCEVRDEGIGHAKGTRTPYVRYMRRQRNAECWRRTAISSKVATGSS